MKIAILVVALCLMQGLSAQTGLFKHQTDIGHPKIAGKSSFDKSKGEYTLSGGGYNIWFKRDEFHYLFNNMAGDFILTAHMKLQGTGKNEHRKIGWMVRATKDDDAAHISAVIHGDGLTVLQWRTAKGAAMRDPEDEIFAKAKTGEVVQLERSGKIFIMRIGNTEQSLTEVGRTDQVALPDQVLAGLIICSHDPEVSETGVAWDVKMK